MPTQAPLHLAVALDGAGWHPAAWREPDAQPQRLFTAGYWTELAQQAEHGLLDFLTIEDGLDLQSDDRLAADSRTDRVRGRLDAVLIAARAAPATRHIGFVPTAVTSPPSPTTTPTASVPTSCSPRNGPGADPPAGLRPGSGEHGPGYRQRLADGGSGAAPLREQKFGECDFRADGPDRGVLAGWEASAA